MGIEDESSSPDMEVEAKLAQQVREKFGRDPLFHGDFDWTSLTFEEQDVALGLIADGPEISYSDLTALAEVHRAINSDDLISSEERARMVSALEEIGMWGDWGTPIERIKALYEDGDDPDESITGMLDILNNKFVLTGNQRYQVKILPDIYRNISKEKKRIKLTCQVDSNAVTNKKEQEPASADADIETKLIQRVKEKYGREPRYHRDFDWTSLTFEEQDVALTLVEYGPELSHSDISAISDIRRVVDQDSAISVEERERIGKTLALLHVWGDWGVPIERIKTLCDDEDPDVSVKNLIEILNKKLKEVGRDRYEVIVVDDVHYHTSRDGKLVVFVYYFGH